jgi:hypothetical protein
VAATASGFALAASASSHLLLTLSQILTKIQATSLTESLGLLLHLVQSLLKVLGLSLSSLSSLFNGSCPTGSKFESLSNSVHAFR